MPESRGFHKKHLCIKDPIVQKKFLKVLAETGAFKYACTTAGVLHQQVRKFVKENLQFAEAVQDAQAEFNESLEMEAHRRAVDGWNEPVYSQKLGTKIGQVRRYSDRLLEIMLKKNIAGYREKRSDDQNVVAGVMVVGVVQNDPQNWVKKYENIEVKSLVNLKEVEHED